MYNACTCVHLNIYSYNIFVFKNNYFNGTNYSDKPIVIVACKHIYMYTHTQQNILLVDVKLAAIANSTKISIYLFIIVALRRTPDSDGGLYKVDLLLAN